MKEGEYGRITSKELGEFVGEDVIVTIELVKAEKAQATEQEKAHTGYHYPGKR